MKFLDVDTFFRRLILYIWSIILIFVMLSLTSCTTPQSIGGEKNNYKKIQNYKVKNELGNDNNFENKLNPIINDSVLSKVKQIDTGKEDNIDTHIPTLREQMRALNNRQDAIESKIDALTAQVNQLTYEIQSLKNIKSDSYAPNNIITGEEQIKIDNNNQTLLSDESVSSIKTEKISSNKSTISNNVANNVIKKQQRKKSIKINNSPQKEVQTLNQTEAVLSQANNLINQKNFTEAEKILVAQLNQESKLPLTDTIKIKLAECYLGNGDSQKAKAIYEEMLKSSPKGELTPIAKKMLQQL